MLRLPIHKPKVYMLFTVGAWMLFTHILATVSRQPYPLVESFLIGTFIAVLGQYADPAIKWLAMWLMDMHPWQQEKKETNIPGVGNRPDGPPPSKRAYTDETIRIPTMTVEAPESHSKAREDQSGSPIPEPYLEETEITVRRLWNKDYPQEALCKCGHPYYRHFDTYEDMLPVGCKYCRCYEFRPEGQSDEDSATQDVDISPESDRYVDDEQDILDGEHLYPIRHRWVDRE